MKGKKAWLLCAALLVGLLLGSGLTALLLRPAPPPVGTVGMESTAPTPPRTEGQTLPDAEETPPAGQSIPPAAENTPAPTPTADGTTAAQPSATPAPTENNGGVWTEWSSGATYLGGDEVLHGGKIYRAKWWTQGETPGKADVWESTGAAPAPKSSAPPAPPASARPGTPAQDGFKVVGYYPSWKPGETGKLDYSVLTHVIYAFAIPTAEGTLRPLENEETAKAIIESAHRNGVQVLIAIGGWSYNDVPLESTFVSATQTEEKRAAFAAEILSLCDRLDFDGVDMDWEHPRVDGVSAAQYESLMLLLAEELHGRGKLLTSAVLSGATADGNIYYDAAAHSDKVLAAVDWINVMAYDGGDGERHSAYDFAVNCGRYWKNTRGMAAEKVVLGVPFYARPSWATYGDILSAVPGAGERDNVQYNGMSVWYNGVPTIRDKTRFAMDELGGVMIWEVTQDTAGDKDSLLSAIGAEAAGSAAQP